MLVPDPALVRKAGGWPLRLDGTHLRCGECGQSAAVLTSPGGLPYTMTAELILAGAVRHVAECHTEEGQRWITRRPGQESPDEPGEAFSRP